MCFLLRAPRLQTGSWRHPETRTVLMTCCRQQYVSLWLYGGRTLNLHFMTYSQGPLECSQGTQNLLKDPMILLQHSLVTSSTIESPQGPLKTPMNAPGTTSRTNRTFSMIPKYSWMTTKADLRTLTTPSYTLELPNECPQAVPEGPQNLSKVN